MWSAEILGLLAAIFALAGFVKGIVGLGLPTVSLAMTTAFLGLPAGMALLLFPSLIANLWQACSGGQIRAVLARIWPLLLPATLCIPLGASLLKDGNLPALTATLGAVLIAYSVFGLFRLVPQVTLTAARRLWLGLLAGLANGMLTGMTGSFVVPGILYLQSAGLNKDALIQAMGILFTLSTLGLAVSLGGSGFLNRELALLSALCVLPALAGMLAGRALRRHIPEARFRQILFFALFLTGLGFLQDYAAAF